MAVMQFTPEDRQMLERLLNQIADQLERTAHPPGSS
jgi:hypothetical protein